MFRLRPVPGTDGRGYRAHFDPGGWADIHALAATVTKLDDDIVHLLSAADDGVDVAFGDAARASGAQFGADEGIDRPLVFMTGKISFDPQFLGQGFGQCAATRRAKRDWGFATSQGRSGLRTADIAALPALRTGEHRLQFYFDGVFLNGEVLRGETEDPSHQEAHPAKNQYRDHNGGIPFL